ncbi:UNVERIFIED_CONTAM: hypothetical protein K2H54_057938 [Gekko kuhli]
MPIRGQSCASQLLSLSTSLIIYSLPCFSLIYKASILFKYTGASSCQHNQIMKEAIPCHNKQDHLCAQFLVLSSFVMIGCICKCKLQSVGLRKKNTDIFIFPVHRGQVL